MESIFEVLTPFTVFWSIFAIVVVVIMVALFRIIWKIICGMESSQKDYIAALNRIDEEIDRISKKATKTHKKHLNALRRLIAGVLTSHLR